MAVKGFSSANYLSLADHADFDFPDGDWAEILIAKAGSVTGTNVLLSNGTGYGANTRQFFRFGNDFDIVCNGNDGSLVTLSSDTWYLLCAQRSGSTVTLRTVEMGTTTVNTGTGYTLSSAINPANSNYIGRDNDGTPSPHDGAISDWFFIPGTTISDSDLQDIATGTAIDSFSWYSSNCNFWAILEDDATFTDQVGGKTITENGSVTSETDPVDLVRFGAIEIGQVTESDTVLGFTASKLVSISQVTESDMAQSAKAVISADVGLVTEADAALSVFGRKLGSIGLAVESDQA